MPIMAQSEAKVKSSLHICNDPMVSPEQALYTDPSDISGTKSTMCQMMASHFGTQAL